MRTTAQRTRVKKELAKLSLALATAIIGCTSRDQGQEVVVYTALDREFSEPVFEQFTDQTGIRVLAKYDTESTKTVGLTNALIAESTRPRCDVFWNNEILNTLRLDHREMLQPFRPAGREQYPARFRSTRDTWYGFAARARVLLINTEKIAGDERPQSILDLADPKWKGQVGMAKPLFGTTATHAAVLFAHWGDDKAKDFFGRVQENAQILSGNKQVALAVSRGQIAWGLTDTDDAIIEIEKGFPVEIVFPDQAENGLGTLLIPNTVSIIRGGPHMEAAKALVEYLLSPEVESRLADGQSAQIPLNESVTATSRVDPQGKLRSMPADFTAAAQKWTAAATFLRNQYARAD